MEPVLRAYTTGDTVWNFELRSMCRSSWDIEVIHCSDMKLLMHVLDTDEIFITVSPDAVDDWLWE